MWAHFVSCSVISNVPCIGTVVINTKICLSDHLFSKTGLLLHFHCRTFLTEITESKAAEDDAFLTPVSDIYFLVLVYV